MWIRPRSLPPPEKSALELACLSGDPEKIQSLLSDPSVVDRILRDENDRTLYDRMVHMFSLRNDTMLATLLNSGTVVDITDRPCRFAYSFLSVLRQIHGTVRTMSSSAMEVMATIMHRVIEQCAGAPSPEMAHCVCDGALLRHAESEYKRAMGELAKFDSNVSKMVSKKIPGGECESARAIQIPPWIIGEILGYDRAQVDNDEKTKLFCVSLSSLVEYLVAEVAEISGNCMIRQGDDVEMVTADHVLVGIGGDSELRFMCAERLHVPYSFNHQLGPSKKLASVHSPRLDMKALGKRVITMFVRDSDRLPSDHNHFAHQRLYWCRFMPGVYSADEVQATIDESLAQCDFRLSTEPLTASNVAFLRRRLEWRTTSVSQSATYIPDNCQVTVMRRTKQRLPGGSYGPDIQVVEVTASSSHNRGGDDDDDDDIQMIEPPPEYEKVAVVQITLYDGDVEFVVVNLSANEYSPMLAVTATT